MAQNIFFYNNTSLAESITDARALYGSQTTGTLLEFQKKYGRISDIPNTYDNIVEFTGNDKVTTWETVEGKQVLTTNTHTEVSGSVTTEVNGVLCLVGIADIFRQACLAMGMKSTVELIDRQYLGGLYPAFAYLCAQKNVSEEKLKRARVACTFDANGHLLVPQNVIEDIASALDGAQLSKKYHSSNLELNTPYSLTDITINNDFEPIWQGMKYALSIMEDETLKTYYSKVVQARAVAQARDSLRLYLSQHHLDYNAFNYDLEVVSTFDNKAVFFVYIDAYLVHSPVKFSDKSFNSNLGHWEYSLDDGLADWVTGIRFELSYDWVYNTFEETSFIATQIDAYRLHFGVSCSTAPQGTGRVAYGNATTITDIPPEGIEYIGDPLTADGGALSRQYPAWMLNAINGLLPLGYGANLGADPQASAQEGVIADVAPYPWEETLPVPDIDPIDPNEPAIEPDGPDPKPDFPPIPFEIPEYDANKLFSVHTIDANNMNTLGGYLWSSSFASLIEHMFSEPIHAVLGLHELHYGGSISVGSSEEIKLGAFGSGAQGKLVTNRYLEFSCGSINVKEHYGNVEDYDPYTKLQLYLPYVGFVPIATNEVMGKKLTVKYGIDVYTGGCVARVIVTNNGVEQELYNFQGQCGCQLPVTSADYSSLVSRPLIGAALGAVTGGAVGAITGGLGGLASARIDYNRTNGFNSNTGVMLRQKPMLIIERPIAFNAQSYPSFYGNPTNWTVTLSECSGYTRVKDIHIDKTKATDEEKLEIERLLKEGVIL